MLPVLVVEYQGAGHVNLTSEGRDAIKKEAVENAGIPFLMINCGDEMHVQERLEDYV